MFGFSKRNKINIRTYGDPVLKRKAVEVKEVNHDIYLLGETLIEGMYADNGVGLAAPQIGESIRMVALGVPSARPGEVPKQPLSPGEIQLLPQMPMVLVNPEIIDHGKATEVVDEGCLSVPGIYAPVRRPVTVTLRSEILHGGLITLECGGLLARAIQHELDHLDGILFVDRMDPEDFELIKPKLDKLKKTGRKRNFLKPI